jgi:oxygen-independent coproporphyrinogen-3 oxidase
MLTKELGKAGYIHYELSSFGKKGFFSKNNTAYWFGKPYLGIGPSAHSFDGKQRSWNIKNNTKYIKAIQENVLPIERETLSRTDRYNEYIMTGLRTMWGVSLGEIEQNFGIKYAEYIESQSKKHLEEDLLCLDNGVLKTSEKGRFLVDGIAADLFMLN